MAGENPAQPLVNEGKKLRDSGRLAEAIAKFQQARNLAHANNDTLFEAKTLILIGAAQKLSFQYMAALHSLELAVDMAGQDHLVSGTASGNKASLYDQMGDFYAAEADSRYAIAEFKKADRSNEFAIKYADRGLSQALMVHASACFQIQKEEQGYQDYQESISIAKLSGDIPLQAFIWNEQAEALILENKVNAAQIALQKAVALSAIQDEIGISAIEKQHLAELELLKPNPNYKTALRLIDEAFASPSPAFRSSPQYYPINIRARILLQSGNKTLALSEFMRAVTAANQWRLGALPGDATSTQTVARLQKVYADYSLLAAETALETHDKTLAINALDVLAENRAASLREQLRTAYGKSGRLPGEYYTRLSELQKAQADVTLGRNTSQDQAKLIQIRLDISNLENKIGIKSEKVSPSGERIPRRNSLRDIQHKLGRDQVLISITLGKRRSYLWTITAGGINLSGLPGEEELTSNANSFAAAIRLGHDASSFAVPLTRALFENLPPDVWNRSEWMIVADGTLLNGIPFCALPHLSPQDPQPGHAARRLIEDKTLRFLPSELLLADGHESLASNTFVGVGDPIYNQADSRLTRPRLADAKTVSENVTLPRLAGSDQEIRTAAREMKSADAILLTGSRATRIDLTQALARNPPAILHFAVHVVSPPDRPQESALALSLQNGVPELLTPETIASFRIPGSLVVLSGCSSGLGKVLPGAGLVGLSRAWLLAGAAAVVVSSWPTPDDSGKFFSSFYDHFDQTKSGDTAQRAALALRQTQLDMLHGSGYKTSPAFWGAFAVIAKE